MGDSMPRNRYSEMKGYKGNTVQIKNEFVLSLLAKQSH